MPPRQSRARVRPSRLWPAAALALLLAAALAPVPPPAHAMSPRSGDSEAEPGALEDGTYVPGEVLARFRDDATRAQIDALLAEQGLRIKAPLGSADNAYVLAITADIGVAEAVRRLSGQPLVVYAEPNRIVRLNPPGRKQPRQIKP